MAPEYTPNKIYHDIALIELDASVTFGEFIKPICLDTGDGGVEQQRDLTIMGFGVFDNQKRTPSDWLLYANVKEMPFSECQQKYNRLGLLKFRFTTILVSQICSYDPKTVNTSSIGKDACQGGIVIHTL